MNQWFNCFYSIFNHLWLYNESAFKTRGNS